ncbi:RluA family pseudouridine synthase [Mesobacillus zeae]|uniref:Pseudouridine synthase n=1 Tax=Mesobacillus zeae TaxID=1917180 RepID=A0A398AWS6_9BACI|nr:RluA family pseudouridine synthase [Mesobacillus zeae]RID82041.1 RluA family pseudouridine synthase [Mesobacillus zeae]
MTERFKLIWEAAAADSGKLLREFLQEQGISKTALTDIKFKGGRILVNGEEVTVRYRLKEGDRAETVFPLEKPSAGIAEEFFPLSILYEDEYFLVINKPAGMSTIPSREHPSGSLANGLIGYYKQTGIAATTHIVTRLDRDTSGIVLVAKHRHVHHLMSTQQKAGELKRTYEALAEGHFHKDEGIVEEPIARKPDSIIERHVDSKGQYACTAYKVVGQYEDFSHIELELKTGRTHQIRVHMAHIGHPLAGDDLYGGSSSKIERQALHCRKIRFRHPFTGKDLHFFAPMPKDLQELLNSSKPS